MPAFALDGIGVYQQARASMVQIVGVGAAGRYSVGSAVALPSGAVITNCHVTQRATRIQLFNGNPGVNASLQAADVAHDLCVLNFPNLQRPPAQIGASRDLKVGDRVYAVGFNAGNGLSYQGGEVAELFEHDSGLVIRTTAPFTHGASGGGLFDEHGKLVGILTFYRVAPNVTDYFAVPVEWVAAAERMSANKVGPLEGVPFWADSLERQPAFLHAGALEADSRWAELEAVAKGWTQSRPQDGQAWMALGKAAAKLGDDVSAKAAFARAAELGVVHAASHTAQRTAQRIE
jgi:S1-C subfamily serine protease